MLLPRRTALALAAVVVLPLMALLLPRLFRAPPSDEQQIRALLDHAARAAEDRRAGEVIRDLSEGFRGGELDRQAVRQLVAYQVLRGAWVSVEVTRATVEVQGDGASAVADVVLSRSGKGTAVAELLPEQASVHRFWLELAREPEGWKVTRARWQPIGRDEALSGPPPPSAP